MAHLAPPHPFGHPIRPDPSSQLGEKTKLPPWEILKSDLVELIGLDDGIGLGDLFPSHLLEIEAATVVLRVPVGPAECHPAPALEPREPHAPLTRHASVRLRCSSHRRLRLGLKNDNRRRRRRRGYGNDGD